MEDVRSCSHFHAAGWVCYSLVAPDSRVVYPLLKCALKVRDGFGATSKPHLLAEVVAAFPADTTLTARDPDFQSNSVADVETGHLGANGHNGTGGLMAQGQGHASTQVTVGELFVVGHIRAADASSLDRDLQLTNTRLVYGPPFLQAVGRQFTPYRGCG